MKKIFSYLGAISLILISFMISEHTASVMKENDEIMTKINEKYEQYNKEPLDATIDGNTIIPGINGKTVNIEESYKEMKKLGAYNPNYYVYDEIKPDISITKTYDKYIISGNKEKNMISLVFLVHDNDDITNIINITEKQNVKVTFFIDSEWMQKNNDLTIALINNNYTIGNLSINLDYENTEFIWMNNILKRIGKQKTNYCYAEIENEANLKACKNQKNYTIKPNIIIKKYPLQEIKQQIKSGSIIALSVNEKTNNELELIINYIKSKGFILTNLSENLSEKNND